MSVVPFLHVICNLQGSHNVILENPGNQLEIYHISKKILLKFLKTFVGNHVSNECNLNLCCRRP